MAKVLAVANQKGGVGKTTTAVNLSAALGALGQRVLLVDCDPQGNATSSYGVEKQELTRTVYQVLVDGLAITDAICATPFGVDLVPANIDLVGAEVELVSVMSRETKLRRALGKVQEAYDFVLIDCPPSLGIVTLNALTAASSVLIPVQCEFFALEGVSSLMETLDLVRESLNEGLFIEGFVMTMFDGRTNIAVEVVERVRENFGEAVFSTLIPRAVKFAEAPSYGQPMMVYEPGGKGANAYTALAKEVLAHGAEWKYWIG